MIYRLMIAGAIALWLTAGTAQAQQLYGQRLQSRDGQWLLPVASLLMCSDTKMHVGRGSIPSWDICIPGGSPIYPTAAGTVIYAGCNNQGGYGCWVKLDHGGGITSAYAHMIEGSIQVRIGQQVNTATVLGQVGWTGMTSFGPHVHFVIYQNGRHVDPAVLFDQAAMQFCDKCSAPGSGPVMASGAVATVAQPAVVTGTAQPTTPVRPTRLQAILANVGQTPPEILGQVMLVALGLLVVVLWLSPSWLRAGIAAGLMSTTCGLVAIWLMAPINAAAPAAATQAEPAGDWLAAYQVVVGSEGAKCTNDGAYTAGGITQGAYDAWRMAHGLGHADVCASLTEQERQQIFYERYWVASGADQLPAALALSYVDHYFNTGKGKDGLTRCGTDVRCFNDWRVSDYRSKRNCSLYCAGWINRVNRIRKLTEG